MRERLYIFKWESDQTVAEAGLPEIYGQRIRRKGTKELVV
jgi:hypothetical protein